MGSQEICCEPSGYLTTYHVTSSANLLARDGRPDRLTRREIITDKVIKGIAVNDGTPVSLEKVVGLSRRDSAVQEIRRAIIQGVLRPGEKVTELALASQLGVSRPTLRETLNQLVREGWLVQEPYRRMHVAQLSVEERLDIARTRHSLDMLAVDAIMEKQTNSRLKVVDQYWEALAALDDDTDLLTRHNAHISFHRSIWLVSGNAMLLRLWPVIEARIAVSVAQDQLVRRDLHRDMVIHHRLIETLHRGDRDEIETAFREHTIRSAKELISVLGAQDQAVPIDNLPADH